MGNIILSLSLALCALIAFTGCKSIGPGRVPGDRFDYSAAISDSWKRQTLLNIVKLRYLDPPIFVDVGQIVASRTLSSSVNLGSTLHEGFDANSMNLGAAGTYTDQPTITYTPLTGNRYVKSLFMPLTPDSVFYMIQAGWPANAVLFVAASEINGLKNQDSSVHGVSPPDPEFLKVLALLRKIQLSGGVAFRIQEGAQKQQTAILTFHRPDISPETRADSAELRRLLRVDPKAAEFTLVFGPTAANEKEIAVQTRSIVQMMGNMAADVEVPPEDLAEHSATPGWESISGASGFKRLIEVHSSKNEPRQAFVAVTYQDHWFWIDRRDLNSKRAFAFMMMMFSLADSGEPQPMPLVTIPAH